MHFFSLSKRCLNVGSVSTMTLLKQMISAAFVVTVYHPTFIHLTLTQITINLTALPHNKYFHFLLIVCTYWNIVNTELLFLHYILSQAFF